LWPENKFWTAHYAYEGGLDDLNLGLEARYGKAKNLVDYVNKAQVVAYEGHRAMFEAYRKNKFHSATGVVQWMLLNAWPSFFWHLFDYYMRPGSSYFAAKKANESPHIQYAYDDRSIVVTNEESRSFDKLKAEVK